MSKRGCVFFTAISFAQRLISTSVILKEMGLPFYDPLLIIEKTDGRMAGDEQWIVILKNKEARHGTDPS